jgi:hypothetical protein
LNQLDKSAIINIVKELKEIISNQELKEKYNNNVSPDDMKRQTEIVRNNQIESVITGNEKKKLTGRAQEHTCTGRRKS